MPRSDESDGYGATKFAIQLVVAVTVLVGVILFLT